MSSQVITPHGEDYSRWYTDVVQRAESEITAATFLHNGEVIALGCENGQVIFLRVLR